MDRLWLTVAMVLLCVLAGAGLWWGWQRRAGRQSTLSEPAAAPEVQGAELAEPLVGLYVSTTYAGRWQDRIVAHGLGRRATSTLRLTTDGVLVDRADDDPIFIPADSLTAAGTAPGIAGKVMGMSDGILVLTWTLGDTAVDTGFRADDLAEQQAFLTALRRILAATSTDPAPTDPATTDGASA